MRSRTFAGAALGLMVAGALATTPARASEPKARTKALIETFLQVAKPPKEGALTPEQRQRNCAAYERLDRFFDFEAMISAAIEPHRDRLRPAQLERFKSDFRELIRRLAYPESGDYFRRTDITYGDATVRGESADVVMRAYDPRKDWETVVTFHWVQDGAWRLVDASFDGDSLVKDYQNQFGRLIEEHGVDGFLQKVRDKLAEARDKPFGCDR